MPSNLPMCTMGVAYSIPHPRRTWREMTLTNPLRRNGNVVVNVVVVRRKTIVVNVHRVETIRVTRSVNYADVID